MSIDPTPASAPPRSLKILGAINLAVGPGLALLNWYIAGNAIDQLSAAGLAGGPTIALQIEIAVFALVGALWVAGGIGLLRERRWGRTVSMVGAGGAFLGLLVSACVSKIIEAWPAEHLTRPIEVSTGAPALSPLYAIALLVVLNLGDVRAWAGVGSSPGRPPGSPPVRASGLAVASFICSLVPFLLLTQIAGLILGIVALRRIGRARGEVGGRGFAIAGVAISSSILALIGGIVAVVLALPKR